MTDHSIGIRLFKSEDADFCFRIRSRAFIIHFYMEIGPEAVAACVNAYLPDDYRRMAESSEFFVAEEGGVPVGFFTIKRIDEKSAELPLIYFDLNNLGKGYGSRCIRFMEEWILSHWPEVEMFFLDTIIPKYNGGFYQKMGFIREKEVSCIFPDLTINALRLSKRITAKQS